MKTHGASAITCIEKDNEAVRYSSIKVTANLDVNGQVRTGSKSVLYVEKKQLID